MWKASPAFRIKELLILSFFLFGNSAFGQKPFEIFEGCRLVPRDWADGDSFMVELPDGRQEVFRLYYIDCIETTVSDDNDRRRLREQGRYFGVEDFEELVNHGNLATEFRRDVLGKPFTVITSFSQALGRSKKLRYYAFIYTSEGVDFSRLLIENGLARNFGVRRETPDGIHRDDYDGLLSDLEFVAAIRRKGIWEHSDPDALVTMREQMRRDERELKRIEELLGDQPLLVPIRINSSNDDELESAGFDKRQRRNILEQLQIAPILSEEDLLAVPYIGEETLKKVRNNVSFELAPDDQ